MGRYNSSGKRDRSVSRRVGRWVAVVALTYLGVCVFITLLQSRLIYFPTRDYPVTPADIGLEFEDLTLETSDGVAIAAWYVPRLDPKGSVIFCHGNAGNISDRLHSIKLLHGLGLNVLIFDYRGYGRSKGRPTEAGTYEDAVATWQYLVETRGESPDRVVLFGRSLGGAVAIELARRHTPAALIVESTFTSLVDVGRLHYPLLPVRLLLTYRYDSLDKVSQIKCPKLFIHGRDDELIPIDNGRRLFAAAAEPKQFLETPGGHNEAGFTYSMEFTDRLAAFIADEGGL
ncbi:MAG: alpha/beta hydrolase [Phycisphaerae bacterium]